MRLEAFVTKHPTHATSFPNYRAFNSPEMIQPNTPLNAAPLGFPAHPDELAITRTAHRFGSTTHSRGSIHCRPTD